MRGASLGTICTIAKMVRVIGRKARPAFSALYPALLEELGQIEEHAEHAADHSRTRAMYAPTARGWRRGAAA